MRAERGRLKVAKWGLLLTQLYCSPNGQQNPFELRMATYDGVPLPICEEARAARSVLLGKADITIATLVDFPSQGRQSLMTIFEVHVEDTLSGVSRPSPAPVYVLGGIDSTGETYAGNVTAVRLGGRGVWFCSLVDSTSRGPGRQPLDRARGRRFQG